MKRLYMLIEGPTEEKFVKEVLCPYLTAHGITTMNPVITWTSLDRHTGAKCKGGVDRNHGWERIRNELVKLMKENPGTDSMFSTMFDFYGFPKDVPGFKPTGDHVRDVGALEEAMRQDVERLLPGWHSRLAPLVLLHEFETFVFVELQALDWEFIEDSDQGKIDQLKQQLQDCGSPEAVNNGEESAPSKRILKQFNGYRKVNQGNSVVGHIGIDKLLANCPHFKSRIDALIAMAKLG